MCTIFSRLHYSLLVRYFLQAFFLHSSCGMMEKLPVFKASMFSAPCNFPKAARQKPSRVEKVG